MFTFIRASTLSLSLSTCLLLPQALALPHTNHLSTSNLLDRATSSFNLDPPPYTPPSTYTGDAVNVTKCFCQDPATGDPALNATTGSGWGHYYQIDYWNTHNSKLYSLSLPLSSPILDKDGVPACWDHKVDRVAQRFDDGNEFAYEEKGPSLWGSKGTEAIYFKGQERDLPNGPQTDFAPKACDGFCQGMVHGMVVARDAPGGYGKTWSGPKGDLHSILSTSVSYTDVDDMCEGCK